jgi:hypothetical protein
MSAMLDPAKPAVTNLAVMARKTSFETKQLLQRHEELLRVPLLQERQSADKRSQDLLDEITRLSFQVKDLRQESAEKDKVILEQAEAIERLTAAVKAQKPRRRIEQLIEHLKADPEFCRHATGFPTWDSMLGLYNAVATLRAGLTKKDPRGRPPLMTSQEEFVAFLYMFHRLRPIEQTAAFIVGVNRRTLWRIYRQWLGLTATVSQILCPWPTYHGAASVTNGQTRGLLGLGSDQAAFYGDCVEIETRKRAAGLPGAHEYNKATYSNYKSRHTLKYLVIIAANG